MAEQEIIKLQKEIKELEDWDKETEKELEEYNNDVRKLNKTLEGLL